VFREQPQAMKAIQNIASLIFIFVLLDMGYSLFVDQPPQPEETTGLAVEYALHFHGVRYVDLVKLTSFRSTPANVAVLDIDGEPVTDGALVTDWRPTGLSFLLGGYLLHLIKHDWKMPESQEVYLKPGQTMTVSGKRNLKISRVNILLDGEIQEFLFDEDSLAQ
jgi:hypothetical protein